MTDHKFTDDDVIKALECCESDNERCDRVCPCKIKCGFVSGNECIPFMAREALALINRQKAELEAKEEEYADLLGQRNAVEMMLDRANYNCDKADEEIEYLKSENSRLITSNSQLEARVCEDRTAIERLQAVHADMIESLRLAAEANKDMSVELDAMRGATNSYKMHYENAIKEFAERLKTELTTGAGVMRISAIDIIDSLVKEMTEVQNES